MTDFWKPSAVWRLLRRGALKEEGNSPGGALKRNMPLVPADSIAGRALVTVIVIMTFLASFVTGIGVLFHSASRDWTDSISREMTIQIRPAAGRDIEAEVKTAAALARAAAGVANVKIFGKSDSERLLEPWLGTGLDLGELPVPRLIVVELGGAGTLDTEKLRRDLREKVSAASLDDHRLWIERLAAMVRSLVAVVALILALVLTALGLAVAFATRGAMAGNKVILDVLHFVGAADDFIAREFQRHFFRLGLRGAAIGVACALAAFFAFEGLAAWQAKSPGGDQIEILFGTFALGPAGYTIIILIGAGIALLTGIVSRIIVFRHLRGLD